MLMRLVAFAGGASPHTSLISTSAGTICAPAWSGCRLLTLGNVIPSRPGVQVWPSNRLVTDPSLNSSLIARASSGAMDRTVSLSNRFS